MQRDVHAERVGHVQARRHLGRGVLAGRPRRAGDPPEDGLDLLAALQRSVDAAKSARGESSADGDADEESDGEAAEAPRRSSATKATKKQPAKESAAKKTSTKKTATKKTAKKPAAKKQASKKQAARKAS
mgnify:CR=1 FL=1